MGLFSKKGCFTNYSAPAPNPDPSRWQFVDCKQFDGAYVLAVKYLDCSNFEGVKVMVFKGRYIARTVLDPHFSREATSPIARFPPTEEGINMAINLAKSISQSG